MIAILSIITLVLILSAIGFIWVKAGYDCQVEFVTRHGKNFAVPCLIFVPLMKPEVKKYVVLRILFSTISAYEVLTLSLSCLLSWLN